MRIVFISDLHCGHKRGLTPESYFNDESNEYQLWVWERWKEFCGKFFAPDYLIVNGDACDGPGVKSLGTECITTSLDEQAEMAATCIKMIAGVGTKTSIHVVSGSGYHSGTAQASNVDMRLADKLNAHYEGNCFNLDLGEEFIQVAHGSGGGGINPDNNLRTEMRLAPEYSQRTKQRCPTILIRSHVHRFFSAQHSCMKGYITPCWEYTTGFMEKNSSNKSPDIGGLVIDQIGGMFVPYEVIYPIPSEVFEAMRNRVKVKVDTKKKSTDWADLQRLK